MTSNGETVSSVAARFGVHRKTAHGWQARYEATGHTAAAQVDDDTYTNAAPAISS